MLPTLRQVKSALTIALLIVMQYAAHSEEQYLMSYKNLKTYTTDNIDSLWKANRIPSFILPVRFDVDIYEITYKVKWIDSTWRKASGFYFVPKTTQAIPYMVYGHGTQIEKRMTFSDRDAQQGICMGFATDGYAALFPHYYGIGEGEGKHLYQHAWSEAMSFYYMLCAVDELNKKININTNGQLFLTGYSQGGHASFAAQKYIEAINDPRFQVTASSPMSGAYDMTGKQEDYMFQEYPRPFYLPYLLLSYDLAYDIVETDNIYSIFKSPYDTLLRPYFEENDGRTLDELDKIMPKVPKDAIIDSLVRLYKEDPNFLFRQKLKENSLTDWKPKAPVQLCYCQGDKEVHYMNSVVAEQNIQALGKEDIRAKNLSKYLNHNTCAAFAVLETKYFFDRFVKKGKNPKLKGLPPFKRFLVGFIKRKTEREYKKNEHDVSRY